MTGERPQDRSERVAAGGQHRGGADRGRYRVWIARVADWQPRSCADVPPTAAAVEPAETGTLSARQAARYVRAFNRVVLRGHVKVWAVAVPVAVRYDGDPVPGQPIVLSPSPTRGDDRATR